MASGKLCSRILTGQPGTSRAAWSGDPALAWKANLIALSQRESFYFIALNDGIYVDRPSVHYHAGDKVDDLRIKIPTTAQATKATQHHHPRYPHGINRLEVGFLGHEEVLASVCDDGDVLLYTISSIEATFEAIDEGLPQQTAVQKFLKPLYHWNVGKSAWGIALQRESRLVAVSCNAAKITIKATALCDGSDGIPVIRSEQGDDLDRQLDHNWSLRGHGTNIPAVTFHCTKESEPTVYLLSSDIDNNVFIWNISSGSQIVCKINIQYHDISRQFGWLVFPIDPDVFRLVERPDELHGSASELSCDAGSSVVSLGVASTLDEQIEALTGSLSPTTEFTDSNLPFSIVHTSTERVSLLHKPFDRIATCFVAPWRGEAPPFQDQHGTSGTMRYARFVPELGVVICGSDMGHVGVFTLTRLNRERQNDTGLGMRLDLILPFQDQIAPQQRIVGHSGFGPLLGIATAPMLGNVQPKRYRLVLEYMNRTLLTYELWREPATSF